MAECTCGPGQYCVDGSGPCLDCSDRSRFQFGSPERLRGPSDRIPGNLRYPRPSGDGLLYRADGNSGVTEIWYSANPAVDAGVQLDGPGVSRSGAVEGLERFTVYFDAEPVDAPGSVQVLAGEFDPQARVLVGIPLGSPFNELTIERSIAVARDVRRAWWMRGHDESALGLATTSLDGGAVEDLELTYATGCERDEGDDATPFATPDGRLLLFSGLARDAACAVAGGKDLFFATTSPTSGLPAAGTALGEPSSPDADDLDPALSGNGCVLYFSSNRQTERFELYQARRR